MGTHLIARIKICLDKYKKKKKHCKAQEINKTNCGVNLFLVHFTFHNKHATIQAKDAFRRPTYQYSSMLR